MHLLELDVTSPPYLFAALTCRPLACPEAKRSEANLSTLVIMDREAAMIMRTVLGQTDSVGILQLSYGFAVEWQMLVITLMV